MLKIYSRREALASSLPTVAMMYPFWGGPPEDVNDPDGGQYDPYIKVGRLIFDLTSLHDCEVAVLPVDWSEIRRKPAWVEDANRFLGMAEDEKKAVIVFSWDDDSEKVPWPNAIVLRTSVSGASTRAANEFAQPSWGEDTVVKRLNSVLPIRKKSPKPTVGFCGLCSKPRFQALARRCLKRVVLRKNVPVPGHDLRWRAIQILQGSRLIETNFILRDQFYGGAVALENGQWDIERKRRVRAEYIDNILASDYTLCLRGTGNYSHRLYETLCCGRIPVFVNTDCVLPYDFATDWKKHCVWVEESDMSRLPEKIAAFHEALSPADFIDLQHACRKFWQTWLSPEGFFRNLYRHLSS